MQLPDPTYMTLKDWADGTMYVLSQYSLVSELRDADWQSWGMAFHNIPSLSPLNPPDPYQFTDWQEWGKRLMEAFGPADGILSNNGLTGSSATGGAGSSATAAFLITQNNINLIAQNGNFIVTQ